MRDVHGCVTVDYQQIENGNIANQIQGFTIDYGKFILIKFSLTQRPEHEAWVITTEFMGFIPQSLMLRSIVLG